MAVLLLAACGNGSSADDSESAALADSDSSESNNDVDGPNLTCALLSTEEVERAVGRTVIDVVAQGGSNGKFGDCTWLFEPLDDSIFSGASPELLVIVYETTEFYDQFLEVYADSKVLDIGDGAFARTPGELLVSTNGNSLQIGTLLAYDTTQEAEAVAVVEQLALLLVGRI